MITLIIPCAGKSSRYPGIKPKWMFTHPDGKIMLEKSVTPFLKNKKIKKKIITITKEIEKKFQVDVKNINEKTRENISKITSKKNAKKIK